MTKRLFSSSCAVSLAFALAAPAHAQSGNPYQDLVESMASSERLTTDFGENAVAAMVAEAKRDPEMLEMEQECPGVLDLMGASARPLLQRSHQRAVATYREQLLALFTDRLTPAEAVAAADFYRSEDGQFLISLAEKNQSVENVLADVREHGGGTVSEEAFVADKRKMEEAIRSGDDTERLAGIGRKLVASDWFANFRTLRPEMHELELALLNDDFTPEEDAALDHVLERDLTAHFEKCYAE